MALALKRLKDTKSEKLARAMMEPANFGEAVLGYKFYPKQKEALALCTPVDARVAIHCCNGGGKTSRLIPTLVLWHMSLYPAGRIKVTSGSWPQIETQVWPAIEAHRRKFPLWKWYETPYVEYKHPNGTAGFVHCFTTNNPGFAEGAHEDGPDQPLLYIIDEAKTCPEWMKKVVVARVRPTRLVLLSSAGTAEGWFYEACSSKDWKTINVTAEDCAHISPAEIRAIRKEWIQFPEFADAVLGHGFIPLVTDAIINARSLDECLANPPEHKKGDICAFCDFAWSTGRGETVLALRNGNKVTIEAAFHCDHLMSSPANPDPGIVETLIAEFIRLNLEPGQISGDEGGGGKLVMDALDARGWCLRRINNDAAAHGEHYANVGAEMWFEGSKAISSRTIILPNDQRLRGQLINRHRKVDIKGKLKFESKEDMALRNVASPDRADAVLGAMMGLGYGSDEVSAAIPIAPSGTATSWANEMTCAKLQNLAPCLDPGVDQDLWPEPCYD